MAESGQLKSKGEISQKVDILFEITESLEKLKDGLKEDLSCVLRDVDNNDPSTKDDQKEDSTTTALGEQLDTIYCQLFYVVKGLQYTKDRIEL